ncbi:hypothetical protein BOTBODRAFT_179087 [Botryobasidium botryosum FD-172 SS1]|uniref:Uncharacterized protein n=1 Tax=Botryobasidium botryosum (strain FD-172 SS1) TaxID=930990 RepID=A0A067M3X5_BOTB1|nr:hypothetical protein BOTBODRAFT_179087 [Botryobasidium botryosum FD-172 SS1]
MRHATILLSLVLIAFFIIILIPVGSTLSFSCPGHYLVPLLSWLSFIIPPYPSESIFHFLDPFQLSTNALAVLRLLSCLSLVLAAIDHYLLSWLLSCLSLALLIPLALSVVLVSVYFAF